MSNIHLCSGDRDRACLHNTNITEILSHLTVSLSASLSVNTRLQAGCNNNNNVTAGQPDQRANILPVDGIHKVDKVKLRNELQLVIAGMTPTRHSMIAAYI